MLTNTETVLNAIRYAVKARGSWETFVNENKITRDQIAETARELAALAYPTDEPVQKINGTRTRFGNAVQAAGNGMRSVLDKAETDGEDKALSLLTKAGYAASLEAVIAAWESANAPAVAA